MRGERPRDSFQATALVHEAYLRLVDTQHVNWQNRAHFLAMAARLMRRILVDLARARQYQKRGGGAIQVSLTDALSVADKAEDDFVFAERLEELNEELEVLNSEARELEDRISANVAKMLEVS